MTPERQAAPTAASSTPDFTPFTPTDYRGVKLLFAGMAVLILGMSLVVWRWLDWIGHALLVVGLPILGTGMVMHWRELLRQDREWREYHRNKRQQEQTSSDSPQ